MNGWISICSKGTFTFCLIMLISIWVFQSFPMLHLTCLDIIMSHLIRLQWIFFIWKWALSHPTSFYFWTVELFDLFIKTVNEQGEMCGLMVCDQIGGGGVVLVPPTHKHTHAINMFSCRQTFFVLVYVYGQMYRWRNAIFAYHIYLIFFLLF